MDSIEKCKSELQRLKKSKSIKDRRKNLREADECLIDAISEISKNFLVGNLELSKNKKRNLEKIKKLKKFKNSLEFISSQRPVEERREKIIQSGGFLNILIPATLLLLRSIIKNV